MEHKKDLISKILDITEDDEEGLALCIIGSEGVHIYLDNVLDDTDRELIFMNKLDLLDKLIRFKYNDTRHRYEFNEIIEGYNNV
jgi:hypothetical protein